MSNDGYLFGFDIGSSSVKATLLRTADAAPVASATSPDTELPISAPKPGWAEQHPDLWWEHVKNAAARLRETSGVDLREVGGIGISYQMHGLVVVDRANRPLRPAIIWCDSRAVEVGARAFQEIGPNTCLERLLNSPGNFTASKLRWVRENEPEIYRKIHKVMLPGDYIAMRLTGRAATTPSGLSEGILWDFRNHAQAELLLRHYDIAPELLAEVVPTFSVQGELTAQAASELGVKAGTPVGYRAGDQPNNAFSLNVRNPGEIAATAGTSGVVYGVADVPACDPQSRVNTFVHVNYSKDVPRYGILLCVNGTGILNSWLKHNMAAVGEWDYEKMNTEAGSVPVGAEGLVVLPFGNGAERTLGNRDLGCAIQGLRFNVHDRAHMLRAAQEGIVFALNYGFSIMNGIGVEAQTVRAGHANMFLSPLFCEAFATVTDATIELYNTDGSAGAARGAGVGCGLYADTTEAFAGLTTVKTVEPNTSRASSYADAYERWRTALDKMTKEASA